ncbi:uncharacterized mitochondrial protein AtMg00810-like isoform X2 [Solanum pennellii]|uniref:Uncharacterized mitochondrial protein AtMg00810-like isoform X2 n=1 Tax=Solanum pennellii TaxID=28526 RepID=A0ABM1V3J4_SOLPN|nr:uncharacterized mitochondrial protein AtMg00810-like isoform X2 [Solanum pennellii]
MVIWNSDMGYHSSFVEEEGVRKACGCPLLPLKSHRNEPDSDAEQDATSDIVDEAITFFRANVFFKNFDYKSSADKLLIYLTLYINLALKRLEGCRTLAEGKKSIINLGLEKIVIPGEAGFPFPGLFASPKSQQEADLIALAGLQESSSRNTQLELNVKYYHAEGDLPPDPTLYWQLVGSLNYLTITWPDIYFAIQQVSQFMEAPRYLHLVVVRRIIQHLSGRSTCGLFFPSASEIQLNAFSDSDWAGCPDTRLSIIDWCMFLGDSLISWKCKKKYRVSKSSTESEYRAMSTTFSEIVWLCVLLLEIGIP